MATGVIYFLFKFFYISSKHILLKQHPYLHDKSFRPPLRG